MHFPSILYLLDQLRRVEGAEVVVVPSDDGVSVETEAPPCGRDRRPDGGRGCVSHVLFKSSYEPSPRSRPLRGKRRRSGRCPWSTATRQSGAVPVNVGELGADVYVGGCLKWLCGGPGAAFLWVRPGLREGLSPRLTGWMAHARPFAFAPALDRRDDAWRFFHGTPNVPGQLYAGLARVWRSSTRSGSPRSAPSRSARRPGSWPWPTPAATAAPRPATPPDAAGPWPSTSSTATRSRAASMALDNPPATTAPGAPRHPAPRRTSTTATTNFDAAVGTIAEILSGNSWRLHPRGGRP